MFHDLTTFDAAARQPDLVDTQRGDATVGSRLTAL